MLAIFLGIFFRKSMFFLWKEKNRMLYITSRYNKFNKRMKYNSNDNINVVNIYPL